MAAGGDSMTRDQSAHTVRMHSPTRYDEVGHQGAGGDDTMPTAQEAPRPRPQQSDVDSFNAQLRGIFNTVTRDGRYNYQGARCRVPSGLCINAWRAYLADYTDGHLVDFLEFGWPVNFARGAPLSATLENHPSALQHEKDVEFYIATELGHHALAGPFGGPPVTPLHVSPLMTRVKKDSDKRRVIVDLSWPDGASVNDGVEGDFYVDGHASIRLPTVE